MYLAGKLRAVWLQAVCLEACKKLHEMGAFTDMLLPDKGSGEEAVKLEGSEEGEPLPGTSRHREYYPEGVAEILKVGYNVHWRSTVFCDIILPTNIYLCYIHPVSEIVSEIYRLWGFAP